MNSLDWSKHVAGLVVDSLIDHGLVRKEDFDQAVAVAAEEINVRLCMDDYPSPQPLYKPFDK